MIYKVEKLDKNIEGEIKLPSSKSISNRVLIINALSKSGNEISNLSESDDTRTLNAILHDNGNSFDVHHAGTVMRFLTAYLANLNGTWHITGSERMQQRPIKVLVEALRELGAEISYDKNEGYPPISVQGKKLDGKEISLDGSVSSQYISALMMIGATLRKGLTLKLENQITSIPYIHLTQKLMEQFGVVSTFEGDTIRVEPQEYNPIPFEVESDWTGASYMYQLAALGNESNLFLPLIFEDSLQGDAAIIKWFEKFGVTSTKEGNGLRLRKSASQKIEHLELDFIENPDTAQTLAVLCCLQGIPFTFKGVHTLKIKETDRVAALIAECAKMGYILHEPCEGSLAWSGETKEIDLSAPIVFDTYNDHRMAMAFAPAAMVFDNIYVNDPDVVTKSYPNFWDDLKALGFNIKEANL